MELLYSGLFGILFAGLPFVLGAAMAPRQHRRKRGDHCVIFKNTESLPYRMRGDGSWYNPKDPSRKIVKMSLSELMIKK